MMIGMMFVNVLVIVNSVQVLSKIVICKLKILKMFYSLLSFTILI